MPRSEREKYLDEAGNEQYHRAKEGKSFQSVGWTAGGNTFTEQRHREKGYKRGEKARDKEPFFKEWPDEPEEEPEYDDDVSVPTTNGELTFAVIMLVIIATPILLFCLDCLSKMFGFSSTSANSGGEAYDGGNQSSSPAGFTVKEYEGISGVSFDGSNQPHPTTKLLDMLCRTLANPGQKSYNYDGHDYGSGWETYDGGIPSSGPSGISVEEYNRKMGRSSPESRADLIERELLIREVKRMRDR